MKSCGILIALLALCAQSSMALDKLTVPKMPKFEPSTYICYRTAGDLVIDGKLDEPSWKNAQPSSNFVDIKGGNYSDPEFLTNMQMLWDDTYLYIGAWLEEPHVWGTLTERDAIIFYDNDFEIFIDPNGDSHHYFEVEINALGTVWDLFLGRPYRDNGPAVHAWDIRGLKSAVWVNGTLNDASDIDRGWNVEMAIPWEVLHEAAYTPCPPIPNQSWRFNFSRVQWQHEINDGQYRKRVDPTTRKNLPEQNWCWSPQGLVDMHYPEMWGYVQFSDKPVGLGQVPFRYPFDFEARWALYQLYYAQRAYKVDNDRYSLWVEDLEIDIEELEFWYWPPDIEGGERWFNARLESKNGDFLHIDHEGRAYWQWRQEYRPREDE